MARGTRREHICSGNIDCFQGGLAWFVELFLANRLKPGAMKGPAACPADRKAVAAHGRIAERGVSPPVPGAAGNRRQKRLLPPARATIPSLLSGSARSSNGST